MHFPFHTSTNMKKNGRTEHVLKFFFDVDERAHCGEYASSLSSNTIEGEEQRYRQSRRSAFSQYARIFSTPLPGRLMARGAFTIAPFQA